MTISFTRTREQVARMVLRKLGALAASVSDVSADMDIIYEAIDLRLKEIHRHGIFWRKVDEVPLSFTLTAGASSASASNDILFPIKMTVSNGSTDDPVDIIGAREYAAISTKSQSGQPTQALWKGSAEFIFHPIPVAAATAKLVYEKIADDTVAATAPDVEVSMVRWLKDLVCYDVADDFGVPEGKIQRLMKESVIAERNIRALNAERKDLSTVAVDDWRSRPERRATDYGM